VFLNRVNPLKFYDFANGAFYSALTEERALLRDRCNRPPPAGASFDLELLLAAKVISGWLAAALTAESTACALHQQWDFIHQIWVNVEEADTIGFGMPAPDRLIRLCTRRASRRRTRIFRSDDSRRNLGAY